MIAADSSVAVAAFASWHEFHERALSVLDRQPALPIQAAIETYSVLTRLPPPHRADPSVVNDFLQRNFGTAMIGLDPDRFAVILSEFAALGIVGGAAYDGLIAATARETGRAVVTFDQRAKQTYDRLGVTVEYALG